MVELGSGLPRSDVGSVVRAYPNSALSDGQRDTRPMAVWRWRGVKQVRQLRYVYFLGERVNGLDDGRMEKPVFTVVLRVGTQKIG